LNRDLFFKALPMSSPPPTITITLSANTSWYLFNFRASTIRALVAAGYRVVCLSPPDDYGARLASLGCEWQPLPMDNAGTNPVRDLALLGRFLHHYRRLKPVVAFHFTIKNNVYGTWGAQALGVAAVNNVSGLGTAFIRPGLVAAVVRTLYRLSQPMARRVFCQNAEDFELLRGCGLVPASRLQLLPGSGVDLQRFHPSLRRARAAGAPLRLLYAGRMLADKGLHELMEAVGRINAEGVRCELSLCGFAGAENVSAIGEQQLQAWAQRPGVRWLGPSDDMPGVYALADAVVLPSYREGMPRSLLEAAAMGLPAVATDVPGCRHIVSHGANGLLCKARSADALHGAVEQLLAMTDAEREALGAVGRDRVEAEFDEQLVVKAALGVVHEVLRERGC
jgi:glycosyltransferase involved in cell wall biosynthesis